LIIPAANRENVTKNSDMPKYDRELISIIVAALGTLLLVASALLFVVI